MVFRFEYCMKIHQFLRLFCHFLRGEVNTLKNTKQKCIYFMQALLFSKDTDTAYEQKKRINHTANPLFLTVIE